MMIHLIQEFRSRQRKDQKRILNVLLRTIIIETFSSCLFVSVYHANKFKEIKEVKFQ